MAACRIRHLHPRNSRHRSIEAATTASPRGWRFTISSRLCSAASALPDAFYTRLTKIFKGHSKRLQPTGPHIPTSIYGELFVVSLLKWSCVVTLPDAEFRHIHPLFVSTVRARSTVDVSIWNFKWNTHIIYLQRVGSHGVCRVFCDYYLPYARATLSSDGRASDGGAEFTVDGISSRDRVFSVRTALASRGERYSRRLL